MFWSLFGMEKNIHVLYRSMWLSKIYPLMVYSFLLSAMLIIRLLYMLSFYFMIVTGGSLLHKYILLPFCEFQLMSWLSWLSGLLVAASEKGRSQVVGACQLQRLETPDLGEAVLIEGGSCKTWRPNDLEHRRLSFGMRYMGFCQAGLPKLKGIFCLWSRRLGMIIGCHSITFRWCPSSFCAVHVGNLAIVLAGWW